MVSGGLNVGQVKNLMNPGTYATPLELSPIQVAKDGTPLRENGIAIQTVHNEVHDWPGLGTGQLTLLN
jgi:hypothetical protein